LSSDTCRKNNRRQGVKEKVGLSFRRGGRAVKHLGAKMCLGEAQKGKGAKTDDGAQGSRTIRQETGILHGKPGEVLIRRRSRRIRGGGKMFQRGRGGRDQGQGTASCDDRRTRRLRFFKGGVQGRRTVCCP